MSNTHVPKPYALDPAWNTRMLWFVDCSSGSKASFATTWDAARWISSNGSLRASTIAIHIPTGVGALLPAFSRKSKTIRKKGETHVVGAKNASHESDREAVMSALIFMIPPDRVNEL